MKMPRGHFTLDGIWEVLFLILGIPSICVVSLVALAIGKIWWNYSWVWLGLPIVALASWWFWLQVRK
jgi:hypothetical protein